MIIANYTPNCKPNMSTLAADSHSMHCQLSMPSAFPTSSPTRDMWSLGDLYDQNSIIAYVYAYIKNFIGASGPNTVAIDNKIEQAMDLVKSHLMFAVREEVEVLKEKISELMDKINQLEHENTILKANATQETLAQLPKTSQHPGGNSNAPNNVS